MKHTSYLVLASVALVVLSLGGCGRPESSSSDSLLRLDSLANRAYAGIYSDPAGTEEALLSLRKEVNDSDAWHGLGSMTSIARLLQGDAVGCDSVIESLKDFVARHPDALYTRERIASAIGVKHTLYGRNDLAADDFLLASTLARYYGNWSLAVKSLANVGELKEYLGNPSESAAILRDALILADSAGCTEQVFSIRTRMATAYTSLGNYSEADRIFGLNDAMASAAAPTDRFFHYSGKGNSFYYRKEYDRALENFRLAASELPVIGDPYMDAVTHTNIGECYLFENQLDSAEFYIDKAVKEFGDIAVNDRNQMFYLNSLQGDLALRSGDRTGARRLLLAIDPDSVDVSPRYEALHHIRLQNFYTAEGDYRQALRHLIKAQEIDDSLNRFIAANYLTEVENRFAQDTTILHTRLRMARSEEKISQLYLWIVGSIVVAFILIAVLGYHIVIRRRRSAREMEALRMKLVGMRLENARNRLSPHFIFNMLNNELPGDNVNIRNLIKLMRMNLELCNRQVISLEEELQFVDVYMDVVKPSLGEGFRFVKELDPTLDYAGLSTPVMMIQIFVENAVRHGLLGYDDPDKRLTLSIRPDGDSILIAVTNTAPVGHHSAAGTGTGLRVVAQTIAALNAVNRRQIELRQSVEPHPDGRTLFTVTLRLPLDYNYSLTPRRRTVARGQ